jgi:hypothetical protein
LLMEIKVWVPCCTWHSIVEVAPHITKIILGQPLNGSK